MAITASQTTLCAGLSDLSELCPQTLTAPSPPVQVDLTDP